MRTIYDKHNDVLYVKDENGRVKTSREHDNSCDIVLSYDDQKHIVGAIVINASTFMNDGTVRNLLTNVPENVVGAIEHWLQTGEAETL